MTWIGILTDALPGGSYKITHTGPYLLDLDFTEV
jgi:hypothetical protein